jgi:uncharacterized protein (TIGR02147 family)
LLLAGVFSMQKETKNKINSSISIFEFENYRDYLMAAGFPKGNYNGQSNTLQKWSSRLGYKSPSSLNMVLKGSRHPSREMQRALFRDLNLSANEAEFFELLIEKEKAFEKGKSDPLILERLEKLSGGKNSFSLSLKEFSLVSKWYFLVIKQLVSTPEFLEDIDWIHRKLRKKVSQKNIRYALKTLEELALIKRDKDNKLIPNENPLKIGNGVSSLALQTHHGSMIEQGFHALTELPAEMRQVSSVTLKMPADRIQEAQDYLYKVLEDFDKKFFSENCNDVYQLNLQLFPHTNERIES